MTKRFLPLLALAGALALLAAACTEEGDTFVTPEGGAANQGISVTGTGRAAGKPDIVVLQLGVQAEARTVATARDDAAKAAQAVVDSLKKNGVDDKDIRTIQFSIEPQYDYVNSVQRLRSYRVTNVLNVTVRKVENAGKVIDDAVAAGGDKTVVQGISFSIDDPTKLEEDAREDAMKEAKDRAEQLAGLAGVKLGKPVTISESRSVPVPQFSAGIIAAPRTGPGEVETPVQAGELEVVVSVSVLYQIED